MMMYFTFLVLLFHIVFSATPINRAALDAAVLQSIQFDETSTETIGGQDYEIGWKRIMSCDEKHGGAPFNFNGLISNFAEMMRLVPYAISIKFIPDASVADKANYAVYTKVCSNPVVAANNGFEFSYTVNVNNLAYAGFSNYQNDWYAGTSTALGRLKNWCFGAGVLNRLTDQNGFLYHACGNTAGIHIANGYCEWDWTNPRSGRSIEMYFGFDVNQQEICDGTGNVGAFFSLDPCAHVTCTDTGNSCTYNQCIAGNCVEQNYAVGHDCSDSDKCNGDEACNGNGVCEAGISVTCDDGNECTRDECDSVTGNCNFPADTGALCDNGDACDLEDTCDENGICQAGWPVACEFGEKCDNGVCVPDCAVFAIDPYIDECSSMDLDAINQAIVDLDRRIDNLQIVDGGKPEGKANLAEAKRKKENVTPVAIFDFFDKDTLIIILLVINMFSFFYICWIQTKVNRKFQPVAVYSSEDESKPMNHI